MKWIKNAGITLLFILSLGMCVSTNAMGIFSAVNAIGSAPGRLDALTEALRKLNIDKETIQDVVHLIERLEKSGLAVIAQLNTGLDEAIQGSSELKALTTMQEQIIKLIRKIQEFKSKSKPIINPENPEKEHKQAAAEAESKEAAHAAALSLDSEPAQVEIDKKFIVGTVQPVIDEIEKALNELKNNIQQRIASCKKERYQKKEADIKEALARDREQPKEISQETSTLSSLEDKEMALNKIIDKLTTIKKLLSPETGLSPAISIIDALVKELTALNKEILDNIKPFKGGLAGVFKDLTEGLSSAGRNISTNIAEDLQRNLRATMGSPEMIKIIENINKWHTKYRDKINVSLDHKQFISDITQEINGLEDLTAGLCSYHVPAELLTIQQKFRDALTSYQQAILDPKSKSVEAAQTLHTNICEINRKLTDHVQGTLASIIDVLKKTLFATVDRCTSDLKYRIDENIENFHTSLRKTINTDLPRTLKKGVGYLTLGTIAACAICHIIWHDRPWQGHLKNIGIATGSIIGMFLVDPIINYFSKPQRA